MANILIVEDEAVIRLDLQGRLEGLGHAVVAMTDTAADGIRLAKAFKPDLVLMDIRLKGNTDGIAAAEQIRDSFHIPVIFLTAFADDDTLLRAKMTEPFGYLHKPCQDRDLKTAIEIGLHKHEVESKLRASELRYKSTVNSIAEGVIAVDSQGRVTLLNPAAEKVTGWRAEEAKGQPVQTVFAVQGGADQAKQVLKTGQPAALRDGAVLRRRDGTDVPVADSVTPVFEPGDKTPAGAVVAFRDVTERLKSDTHLRHAQKLESLGVMASGIAHDFNNLLTPVLGFATLLRGEVGANARAIQMIEQIEQAAKRAAGLTRQLLSYSGKETMAVKPVSLTKLVADLAALLTVTVSRKAELTTDLADPLPLADGDESQLQQVVMNLLLNASEALPDGAGHVRVKTGEKRLLAPDMAAAYGNRAAPPGEYVFLEVADDGAGMAPETVAKIFDPFFTTKFTGRGLGLAAVLGIVQAHRGALFVDSAPGRGTTFRVFLPRSHRLAPLPAPAPAPVGSAAGPAHGHILIVDDEKPVQAVLRAILEKAGYQALTADDGRQAVDRFGDRLAGIDVAMIDLLMPRMDGLQTARELRARRPDLKIVLMSGFAPEELSGQLKDLIVSAILQKPFQPDSVLGLLSTVLKR